MEAIFRSQGAVLFLGAVLWNAGSRTDLILFSVLALIRHQYATLSFFNQHVSPATVIDILKLTLLFFTIFQIYRYLMGRKSPSYSCNEFAPKSMLFPCQTTHTRIFPKKHSFSYSYLLVGIPVGWKGSTGGMISSDVELDLTPWYRRILSLKPGGAWYTVNGDDYLARGHVEGGLRGKLDGYLLSQVCINSSSCIMNLLMISLGRDSIRIPNRLPPNCGSLSRILQQPRVNLESLFYIQIPLSHNPRSQQYLRRAPCLFLQTLFFLSSSQ